MGVTSSRYGTITLDGLAVIDVTIAVSSLLHHFVDHYFQQVTQWARIVKLLVAVYSSAFFALALYSLSRAQVREQGLRPGPLLCCGKLGIVSKHVANVRQSLVPH